MEGIDGRFNEWLVAVGEDPVAIDMGIELLRPNRASQRDDHLIVGEGDHINQLALLKVYVESLSVIERMDVIEWVMM